LKLIQEKRQIAAANAAKLLGIPIPDLENKRNERVENDVNEFDSITEREEYQDVAAIRERNDILDRLPCIENNEPSLFSVTIPYPPIILPELMPEMPESFMNLDSEQKTFRESFPSPPGQTLEEISINEMRLKLAEYQRNKDLERKREKQQLLAIYKVKR
jgi:hypothetical protein